ncbi:MAG: hypothetical protein UT50_C0013G0012 [Candidatus Moranbacteria bacterium GW2011_GWA2_39_41]|nr:MAG: hypothetical protein UT50_C0013G0012 [Candidatus Moranbacteria bacterium GW2011_GWA2_39_41]
MRFSKIIFIIVGIAVLVGGANFVGSYFGKSLVTPIALADDDEDDDEDGKKTSIKTVTTYQTVYVKLPDTVVDQVMQVPLHDSDSDGIYDDQDPYPYINKFFVVSDENLNGIDDTYEKFDN